MTTTTLYKIVQSELYALGHDHEIVDKQGNLVFFDNKFQVMSKIMSYDEDIKKIINHLFNGYGLEKQEHDTHFKKMFFYRFINREINRQTVESFMFELMSTFMMNQDHINRVYNDLEKYILQRSTSETSNKQLSKEISQQINQQVANQLDERFNRETSESGNTQNTDNTSKDNSTQSNTQNTDNTSKDNSIQNTTNNTTDESTGKTSSTSNQDTTQDTTQSVNGNTTTDNRQARSDLPQNRVNLDVNNTLMAERFQIFNYRFHDDELEEQFNDFFNRYNLTPLFTNEHRTSGITISYIDAKSVVNVTGKYHSVLKEFSDYINTAMDNKMYESALFKIIYQANSFQGLIGIINRIMKHIENGIDNKHLFNMWNIVWYTKEVY